MRLAGCQEKLLWGAEPISDRVVLRPEPAARSAKQLIPTLFMLPAACTWARMIVESNITHSKSGACRAAKTVCYTPFFAQGLNCWKTLFHGPKRSGRSRHDAPVRVIYSTVSQNKRLVFAAPPGNPQATR